ncbi:acyl-CoA carboxylase epsilon subunit [Gryllotalpicola reticulitermitis]|uniref:Acyl-CoA carboxylase epsilon subunit n=1 Tax=Gryllotalpicola reticulitermitis TaxID=1184153 RepID=A0ABV8Q7T3_9MICO
MTAPAFDEREAAASIRFVTEGLTPEEVAAATVVLTAALREQSFAAGPTVEQQAPSAWARSARSLRQPLVGGWCGFTAEGL